jgi:hypothetical protein
MFLSLQDTSSNGLARNSPGQMFPQKTDGPVQARYKTRDRSCQIDVTLVTLELRIRY